MEMWLFGDNNTMCGALVCTPVAAMFDCNSYSADLWSSGMHDSKARRTQKSMRHLQSAIVLQQAIRQKHLPQHRAILHWHNARLDLQNAGATNTN